MGLRLKVARTAFRPRRLVAQGRQARFEFGYARVRPRRVRLAGCLLPGEGKALGPPPLGLTRQGGDLLRESLNSRLTLACLPPQDDLFRPRFPKFRF